MLEKLGVALSIIMGQGEYLGCPVSWKRVSTKHDFRFDSYVIHSPARHILKAGYPIVSKALCRFLLKSLRVGVFVFTI